MRAVTLLVVWLMNPVAKIKQSEERYDEHLPKEQQVDGRRGNNNPGLRLSRNGGFYRRRDNKGKDARQDQQ